MADNKENKTGKTTPNGNEVSTVKKENIFQKAGNAIENFKSKHEKGVKWAKRGIAVAAGALLFGAGCKVGKKSNDQASDNDGATDDVIEVFDAPDEVTTEADNN